MSAPPLATSIKPAKDWSDRATPRAQTVQDFDEIDRKSHHSNLEGESLNLTPALAILMVI